MMKRSARVATFIIFLFFLFFNALQIYLAIDRISETRKKFSNECTTAMLSTMSDYGRLKAVDSASRPTRGWIVYSQKDISLSRRDSQTITLNAAYSSLKADTVEPAFIETIVNVPRFRTIDLKTFDSIFSKALRSRKIQSDYRIDTITTAGGRSMRQAVPAAMERKKNKEYAFATGPMRMPYNSNIFVFAQVKKDPAFTRNDLLWPLLAFALILLISNTALVFVYRTIRKQKRINEVKTEFINNLTHEMKTPITIASAGMDALEHHITPTERTNFYLHTSRRQMHLLNEFVERILDAAVRDISGFTLKKEQIDLQALFVELIQSHSILREKPVTFHMSAEGAVNIEGDRLHLETAFHNIIDNAIKYSDGTVTINIDIVENSRDCTIKIRDNGMGIQPQYLKNIFDKFFRVPQGDAQAIKGFGLGLYYVNNIVKKHGGSITVHSKEGSGTEFIITLPKN